MQKILTAAIVVALIVAVASWLYVHLNTASYITVIETETAQVEAGLDALAEHIAAGTLTTGEATLTRAQIISHLDVINQATALTTRINPTTEQLASLAASLQRLEQALDTHEHTLIEMDRIANASLAADDPQLRSVVAALSDTVAQLRTHITDTVD